MSRSLHPPTGILKFYIEALAGFSHVFSPDGFNNILLSQGYVPEMAPAVGTLGRVYIPKTGKGCRDTHCRLQLSGQPVVTSSINSSNTTG